eukprot:300455-Pelagomonas_calceolata.AAC.3
MHDRSPLEESMQPLTLTRMLVCMDVQLNLPRTLTSRALKASPQLGQALLSIDTYRAEVARQAVEAGADMVNDVSGGTLDACMLPQVRVNRCTSGAEACP